MKHTATNRAYAWQYLPFLRLLLPLMAGIICYYHLPLIHASGYNVYALAVLCLLYAAVWQKNLRTLQFVLIQLIMLGTGYCLSYYGDNSNKANWYGHTQGTDAVYTIHICAPVKDGPSSWRLTANVLARIDSTGVTRVSGKGLVYVAKGNLPLLAAEGDTLLVPGNWEPIRNPGNPFEFDYAAHCRRQNFTHRQWCNMKDVKLLGKHRFQQLAFTGRLHSHIIALLGKYLSKGNTRGLAEAMLLGEEAHLDDGTRQAYTDTGIVHILVISGGNISLLFLVIAIMMAWLRHRKHAWLKYAIGLPLIWIYVIMAGADPSAVRAGIMFSLLSLGVFLNRPSPPENQLLATAFVLLCAQPAWLFSPGFQLSFAAVLSIQLFYRPLHKLISIPPSNGSFWQARNIVLWTGQWLWQLTAVSIAAEILVAPIIIYYFHSFPLLFVVTNVLAGIFALGVLALATLVALCGLVYAPLATALAYCLHLLTTTFGYINEAFRRLNPEALRHIQISLPELLLLYAVIVGLAMAWVQKRKSAWRFAAACAAPLLLLLGVDQWKASNQRRIVVYNVAHHTVVEQIEGKHYYNLSQDTAAGVQYVTNNAHTGWHAWRYGGRISRSHFSQLKTKLYLWHARDTSVTYANIVVATDSVGELGKIVNHMHCKTLVLGSNYSRASIAKIEAYCHAAGIRLHYCGKDGAYIFNYFDPTFL